MEFGSKKLGRSGLTGTSIYDGVFSGAAPFRPSSSSVSSASRPEDYAEVFGGPRDSRRSSIPVLDVPSLHERRVPVDLRSSKLEYSNIFGGGSDDAVVSYEEVVVKARKMKNLPRQEQNETHTPSSSEVSFGGSDDSRMWDKASHSSPDKVKKQFNVSYNRSVGGVKDGLNAMTHVAQLRDVAGFACLVDESNHSKQPKADEPVTNGAYSDHGANDQVAKTIDVNKSSSVPSSSSPEKQYSKGVRQSRSRSNSSLFEGYEFGLRTEPSEVQASSQPSPVNMSEGGVSIGSPSYFDEEVDASSVAAASANAVRKAIEQAQARIKIAKEMMERRKEAFRGNGDPKSLWETRREPRKASKVKETEHQAHGIPMRTGSVDTYINHQDTNSNNFTRHRYDWSSRDTEEYNFPQKMVERDARKLTIHAKSDETEPKSLESMQSADKTMPITDDCEVPKTRAALESAEGVSRESSAVEAAPLLEVHHKTECRPSTAEVAREPYNNSDKSESHRHLQYVEANEKELEEKRENAEELTVYSDNRECRDNPEGFHKSSLEMKIDVHRLEEKTVRAEVSTTGENQEKISEGYHVGSVRSEDIPNGAEEKGETTYLNFTGIEGNGIGREYYVKECDQEPNEKQRENCEAEGNVGLKNISDGELESTSFGTIERTEESGEAPNESCETKGENKLEPVDNLQESKKEQSGFSLGTDARHWLDHMKEILHVRLNSFLDSKENNKPQEEGEVDNNCQLRSEISDEKIVEETGGVEAIDEPHGAHESLIDEETKIAINMRREDEGQASADEGKEDAHEFMQTVGVSDEVNMETVIINWNHNEDQVDEVMEYVSNQSVEETKCRDVSKLSVDEKECLVANCISSDKGEPADLCVDKGDLLYNNVEKDEVCGSETSDFTRSTVETDGEKQIQDATNEEVPGFSESDVKFGFTGIKFGFWQNNHYAERTEEVGKLGKHMEDSSCQVDDCCGDENASEFSIKEEEVEEIANERELETELDDDKWSNNEKVAEVSSSEEEVSEGMTDEMEVKSKVSDDQRSADNEATEENQIHFVLEREVSSPDDNQEATTSQAVEMEENQPAAQISKEKETEDVPHRGMEMERQTTKKRDERKRWEKDNERDREKERLAVERAIREARERAFAEARERAERAAVEKAAAEARQRVMAQAREKLGKPSSETLNKTAEKTSADVRLRAERAAVERATAEARERALERAMSEKLSGVGKDNKARPKPSHDPQQKSSVSSNHRNSSSSSNGVPWPTEKSNGTNAESEQWSKARQERHQRTAERAAKALAEKNMRDLLVQREQAERNRLAEALDADIKRWSSGKQGNLRALLSTLQYILGPDSGWQPVTLTEIVTAAAVKKAYRKATLCVHPDKLQQRGASLQQKYICEKVFDLLKEAWNRFSSEEK